MSKKYLMKSMITQKINNMDLKKITYWKTKKSEDFYVFMAKITRIDQYNPDQKNGKYNFDAEYYMEYPLSGRKATKKGQGYIYHNQIKFLREIPKVNTIITLMARPVDLEMGINWEINQGFTDPIPQSILDFISENE